MKKILLLATGGTIASVPSEEGYIPVLTGEQMIKAIPKLGEICKIEAKSIMSLDSTNMQPENWIEIAENIYDKLDYYDGFVITHGTDTMAYTASALTFMLKGMNKPIVLTGSQIPYGEEGSDAERNIIDAFLTASQDIAGVFIVFDGKITKGCCTTKIRTKSFDAFCSINRPNVGFIKNMKVEYIDKPSIMEDQYPKLNKKISSDLFVIKLVPGTNPEIFDAILKMNIRAVIIESFGAGGVPFEGRNLLPYVKNLINKGICVVITTQCLYEGVDLNIYEVGKKALKEGVISAHDMTIEALYTKLMLALGNSNDINEIKEIMLTNYAGENPI